MAVATPPTPGPERLPPHNIDAEEAVLGSILIDREAIARVSAFLKPEDFYRERNAIVYRAMLAMHDRHEPIDFLALVDELQRSDQYDRVGGMAFLSSLLTVVPTSLHVEQYARIVERTSVMRRLIEAGGRIAALGFADEYDIATTLEKAEQVLLAVAQRRATREFESLAEVLREYLETSNLLGEEGEERLKRGIPTGFIDLDKMLGGLQRSDLIILAARPSLGKTSLALNFAQNAAVRFNATVAIFSLEMSKTQLAARLIATETGIDSTRLRTGQLTEQDRRKLSHAIGVLSQAPIYIDDTPGISITELRSKARRLHAEVGVDLVVVDYLQLIVGRATDNRVQEISEISRSLKALARELHVPVLAISQLSRAVESRSPHIPMLSDLRESGSIEQDADVVLFIYRDDYYNRESEKRGIADIYIAKHRNGPVGQVSLLFLDKTTKFLDLEVFRQ